MLVATAALFFAADTPKLPPPYATKAVNNRARVIPQPAGAKLTLFKFMGVGLGDLAAGIEIYRRALAQGKGIKLPHAVRFPVDLS